LKSEKELTEEAIILLCSLIEEKKRKHEKLSEKEYEQYMTEKKE